MAAIAGAEVKGYIQRMRRLQEEKSDLLRELIISFVTAIDAKDHYLHNHSFNVSTYSRHIAQALDFQPKAVEEISLAALFHDIGKLSVDEDILNKPSKLTEPEWTIMKLHASQGPMILNNVGHVRHLLDYIKYHHRQYDGSGYPDDCSMEDVPFESHIIAVADAFDAMTSDRPYRKALPLDIAYAELRQFSGKQFHPDVVDAFFRAQLSPDQLAYQEIDFQMIFE